MMPAPYPCLYCAEEFTAIWRMVVHRQEKHQDEWAKREPDPFSRFERRAS